MENHIESQSQFMDEGAVIQLIVFRTSKEEFGVLIEEVREIIKLGVLTPIPDAPKFIQGIINVRGEIVTAIDLKIRFSLPNPLNEATKHVVVTKQEDSLFGLMVDEVIEVLRVSNKDIKPPPSIITKIQKKYIRGIVSHNGRLIIILDLSQVLSQDDLTTHSDDKVQKKNKIKRDHHQDKLNNPQD